MLDKEIATAIKIRRDLPHADLQFENAFNKLTYDRRLTQRTKRLIENVNTTLHVSPKDHPHG